MKKWIGLTTAMLCALSPIQADDILPEADSTTASESTETTTPPADDQAVKHVGEASTDAMATAHRSAAGKYVLAATAIAVGVIALILVSRHSGHHSHK